MLHPFALCDLVWFLSGIENVKKNFAQVKFSKAGTKR